MDDNTRKVFSDFFNERTESLEDRFDGLWRAVVVETNDPLRMRRVRFKIPELHDWTLKPEECPWAVTSSDLGTKRCGRFSYPCVGDWVWIQFEKNHPYGPIMVGFADPTRRKFYPLPSLHGKTPIPVDENSDAADQPEDFDPNYMPADERPMSHGWQDRYGNLDIHDSTGFFPIEHLIQLPPPDTDQQSKGAFAQSIDPPVANAPDSKMMCRISKYGNVILQSDMGYKWKEEFGGDFDEDEQFEIDRWLYLQKLLHEDDGTGEPDWHDQRRMMQLTRYGHKFEMRDVGWNKTREKEYSDESKDIGDGEDERWMKMRTKGGMLIQASDIGMDPENDEFTKRLLQEEVAEVYLDKEDQFTKVQEEWNKSGTRDMRMLRFVSRSGIKVVIDDRTSHDGGDYLPPFSSSAASRLNQEIGIGVLVKGRATPGTKEDYATQGGDPRGYYWQFDERPDHNSTAWGTPMGQVVGMDDNEEYLAICSRLPELPTEWKNLSDNEFLEQSIESLEPHTNTHHLIIDHGRDLIRLKSRAGLGDASRAKKLGESATGEHAGLEIHDAPSSDPWVELIDIDKRGLWFNRQDGVGIWRGKEGSNVYIWLDDKNNNIILRNGAAGGKVQVYCQGNVDIISDKVVGIQANQINLSAKSEIRLSAAGTNYTFGAAFRMAGDIHAPNVYARFPNAERPLEIVGRGIGQQSGGGNPVSNLQVESLPPRQEPSNRL